MRKLTKTCALAISATALTLCLAGCGGGTISGGATTSASELSATYYDEAESIPTPDSITDAKKTTEYSNSGSGGTSYSYIYSADQSAYDEYLEFLNGDGLTTQENSDGGLNLISGDKKLATVSYENDTLTVTLLAASDQTTLKSIKLEEAVQSDRYSYTIHSFSWEKEIYPPNTSGYYQYVQEVPNFTYLKFEATFKNEGTNDFSFNTTDASVVFDDGTTYSANIAYVADQQIGEGSNNTLQTFYSLAPKQEVTLYIYASVADEIMNSATSATLNWTFSDGNEYSCAIDF